MYDLVIIGAGIAGMTAAIYGARSGLSVLLLEKRACGGQITEAAVVENYPGTGEISGAALSEAIRQQVAASGAELLYGAAEQITPDGVVHTDSGTFPARAVVLANGVTRRHLGVAGEAEFAGRGVSYCSYCDGSFFRGKDVAVVGGGNTAVQEALYLSGLCHHVHLIHRRQAFTAQARQVAQLYLRDNVSLHMQAQVTQICGSQRVNGVQLAGAQAGFLPVDGVFIAAGLQPENALTQALGVNTPQGYVNADSRCRTALPWLFAAGDTREAAVRQLVTAAADGATTAIMAGEYLRSLG